MPSVNGNHRQSANRPNDRTLNMWTIVLLIMTVLMLPSVGSGASVTTTSVSYTHLDVYKRQAQDNPKHRSTTAAHCIR